MKNNPDRHVVVGEILRPHGVRGEIVVRSFADSPSVFQNGRALRLTPPQNRPGNCVTRTVTARRSHAGNLLVTLSGIDDRDAVETLRGFVLSIPEGDLPPPPPGEYYRRQLIGCRVLAPDTPHPVLGVLDDILDMPGQEVWRIIHESGKEILLPANPHTIASIDLETATIIATPPPGLVEVYIPGAAAPDPARGE
ncbi:ribosome maturation factor RimM [Desulfolutivibrio sulfoxidireducens]|uniref:ribosome maturation factor RimM n=1 Tax=Desulfolutivibrio sulfoxidireducens TaxID=2773299 RepID=UPI00159D428A|nr:ribosome maturation factor RimM [Desulfolutivibrio sulfoxidireducens]QLA17113.1 16S rRNA processing protein RimM [Desulfolutivibrio sulfoxidireducens]